MMKDGRGRYLTEIYERDNTCVWMCGCVGLNAQSENVCKGLCGGLIEMHACLLQ